MKKALKTIFAIAILLGFTFLAKPVYAQTCTSSQFQWVSSFNRTGENRFCVGGFNSLDELRNTSFNATCERSGSLLGTTTFCALSFGSGRVTQSVTLGSILDTPGSDPAAQDSAGKWYMCPSFTLADSDVHGISVSFTRGGVTYCQTGEIQYVLDESVACPNGVCNTALGPINTRNFGESLRQIFIIAIGIGGALALLLMGFGVFIITTSAGIPDKINEGKNIITAAAAGLVFIILSIVIFQLIGINILGIPGLQ